MDYSYLLGLLSSVKYTLEEAKRICVAHENPHSPLTGEVEAALLSVERAISKADRASLRQTLDDRG